MPRRPQLNFTALEASREPAAVALLEGHASVVHHILEPEAFLDLFVEQGLSHRVSTSAALPTCLAAASPALTALAWLLPLLLTRSRAALALAGAALASRLRARRGR